MSVLSRQPDPTVTRRAGRPAAADVEAADVWLIAVDDRHAPWGSVPHGPALQRALALASTRAGQHATFHLASQRQTLVVVARLEASATPFQQLAAAGRMLKAVPEQRRRGLIVVSTALDPARDDAPRRNAVLEALAAGALAAAFEMPRFQGESTQTNRNGAGASRAARRRTASSLRLVLFGTSTLDVERVAVTSSAANLSRWLTALPPNRLRARDYRRALGVLARSNGLGFRWFGESQLRRAGAGAFLAVSSGNARRDAGIAHLTWRPPRARRGAAPDVALVGKGILFDTGGTNLKPHRAMLDMHTDMAGSATALAALIALARLRVPLRVDAWLAITENLIGPDAYRPQDVVTAANGVTIQVIHTDAEGRMALADTLALASRSRPRLIVDFATLTGSCVVALTERISGVFTNREEALRGPLEAAGRISGERVHCFPNAEDFDADLESRTADVLQCAVDGKGDHILAARFLGRFVDPACAWAHVDLTSALRAGGLGHVNTDITGFGVRWTLEFLLGQRPLEALR